MSDLEAAVDEAVRRAEMAYEGAEKNPMNHGFAHIEVDGRTSLASALQAHPDIDAGDTSYVTIDGLTRYLTPQRKGYRKFVDTLEAYDIDTDHIDIRGRLD